MQNNPKDIARQEITACLVINSSNVTMNFTPASNGQVIKKVKNILVSSFSRPIIQNGNTHLDNRILMQP